MNYIKLYTEEYDPGVTLVSNVFIDYFLKDANDAQLKIYLYLVRHISNHKPFTISNIADEFNHTEKDILRALSYWEQKQVISLEYDGSGNLTGIEFNELNEKMFRPAAPVQVFPVPSPANLDKNDDSSSKATVFTSKDFVELSKDDDWLSIKSIAENYLGRTLSANDLQALAHIYRNLAFTPSDVDKLFDECLSNGKKTMRSIKKVADELFFTTKVSSSVSAVMSALGETSAPTSDQLAYINRWLSEMSLDLVLDGCHKATMRTNSNRFLYADGIFRRWISSNITTIEEVAASEEAFRQSRELAKKTPAVEEQVKKVPVRKEATGKFSHYKRTYDFEALEREIRIN